MSALDETIAKCELLVFIGLSPNDIETLRSTRARIEQLEGALRDVREIARNDFGPGRYRFLKITTEALAPASDPAPPSEPRDETPAERYTRHAWEHALDLPVPSEPPGEPTPEDHSRPPDDNPEATRWHAIAYRMQERAEAAERDRDQHATDSNDLRLRLQRAVDGAKAAGEARVALKLVSGALVDAGSVVVPSDERRYGDAVRELIAERGSAIADRDNFRALLVDAREDERQWWRMVAKLKLGPEVAAEMEREVSRRKNPELMGAEP